MKGQLVRKGVAALYAGPKITSYTDACEAPQAMWDGAIPLKQERVFKNGVATRIVKKTYSHPPEIFPANLSFNDVNSMYCLGNDELIRYFPEGLGGKVMQMMPPGHPRGFLYRAQSHLLNCFIDKLPFWQAKEKALHSLTNGRSGLIFDGPTGAGKSAILCQAVHYARSRGIITLYVPNAKTWTHGEWCWPSTILPGFFDVPDAAREFLRTVAEANRSLLKGWDLKVTPQDLPVEQGEGQPRTLYDLCEWGHRAVAPASIDRQSVCIKFLFDEISAEKTKPIVIAVDGWNLFSHETHFRYPHPDFLRTLTTLNDGSTDVDLYPQELPRIPASRLSFVRGLNKLILSKNDTNKFFITCTTRDFKPFDGISGFADVENDRYKNSLDEYAPYDPEKDSFFHPVKVENFNEYEYRSFLRFAINSGELAGLGWGPMWHYSSDFERKLYKIGFMSDRNPQRVVDHYHQELVWRYEYKRTRQKQYLLARRRMWQGAGLTASGRARKQ
ncbi:Mitochondrial ribosomal death-associated protein 3 [Lotmaria passim]